MTKRLPFLLSIAMLFPFLLKAGWVQVGENKTSSNPPEVTLISDDGNSTVLKIDLSGYQKEFLHTSGKTYQTADLLTDIFTNEPGQPSVPYLAKILAVPDHAVVSAEVLEVGGIQTFEDIYLPPARESWFEGKPEAQYIENKSAYQSNEKYPGNLVSVDPPSVWRDFRIARISVYPVQYIPAKKELQVASSITVKVNYSQGKAVNPKTSPQKPIAPSYGKLYKSSIFNYESVLNKVYDGEEEGTELMLCILPDEFEATFLPYAQWKRESGTDVHITLFSDIGANANNPDIIKNHILDAYNNWETVPTYVLIVGDDGVFPKKIITYPDYSFPYDDYFVELEGNDHFPEMMIGRFTNQGDYRLQVMLHKFMLYEKTPYVAETDWFKKGIVCSNNYYASQVYTKRFAASEMLENGQFTSVDTMMSDGNGWGGGCTYDLNDVTNAINDGRAILNYRGEGWSDGWSASCYSFHTSDVYNLQNGQQFTFVTSIGCGVAMFDAWGSDNCFGEAWVEMGTIDEPRGACAFVGPTSNTHTTYNNKIDKGIYVGMFEEGMNTPGEVLDRGRLYLYNVYGSDFWVEYHYRIYHILGDPSLHVWKDVPLQVNIDHPASIIVGDNSIEVTTTFASNSQPVAGAEVTITGQDVFATAVTDEFGKAYLDFEADYEEDLVVTVRGGNVYPIQETIAVTQPLEQIAPVGEPPVIDLDGNMDGLINPGETCSITYTLKNWGNQMAGNVQATLSTSDPDLVEIISTGPINFGNMNPGSQVTGNPFQIHILPDCPVGTEVNMHLHITSNTSNWDYDKDIIIHGCDLMVEKHLVYDEGVPGMNYRLDPGETAIIVLSVDNNGEDIAPDVLGILKSNDPYITVNDSIGAFGTMNIGANVKNTVNYFEVSVDPGCPAEYWPDLQVKFITQNGNYPYQHTVDLEIPVGILIPIHYTGPDAYGYYAYASTDAFYQQTPTYNWVEIDGIGNELSVPSGIGDYTVPVTLPFSFKYYGVDYNELRISTDGWVAFGGGSQTAPVNQGLPYADNVSAMVAPFWEDLYSLELVNGDILYYNDVANHRFIVQWDSIAHNNILEPHREVLQAILLDPAHYPTTSGDGEIIFQYKKIVETESITIGIENHEQNIGLQYLFNNNYDPTAAELEQGVAIKFTTEPPYIYIYTGEEEYSARGDLNADGYLLDQNQPNPFSSETVIYFTIPESTQLDLIIYNSQGQVVKNLMSGKYTTGTYSHSWDGTNNTGNAVDPGIYFYRLQTEKYTATKKMFLLK